MLVYRQKGMNPVTPEGKDRPDLPKLPAYQKEAIDKESAKYQKEREVYEDLKNQVDLII